MRLNKRQYRKGAQHVEESENEYLWIDGSRKEGIVDKGSRDHGRSKRSVSTNFKNGDPV